jgi:hypothetical protein
MPIQRDVACALLFFRRFEFLFRRVQMARNSFFCFLLSAIDAGISSSAALIGVFSPQIRREY